MFESTRRSVVASAVAGCILAASALADTNSPEEDTVQFFKSACYDHTPEYWDAAHTLAQTPDWKRLKGETEQLVRPADPNAEFAGWIGTVAGKTTIIGVSKGQYEGLPMQTCITMSEAAGSDTFADVLNAKLELKTVSDTVSNGARVRVWQSLFAPRVPLLIMLTTYPGRPGGTLAVIFQKVP